MCAAPRSLEARPMYGDHLNGTENLRQSLAYRFLIVCFSFSHESILSLRLLRNSRRSRIVRRLANRAFYVSVRRLHFDIVVTFPGGTPSVWSGISIQAASGLSSGREKPNHWYASNIPRPSDDTHPTPEVFLPHARLAGSITLAPAIQCWILLELSGKQCGTALLLRLSDASHAQALRQFESAYHCIIACLTVSRTRHTESLSRSRSSSARIQNPAGSTSPCDSGSVGDFHNLGECNSKVQDGMTSSVSRVPLRVTRPWVQPPASGGRSKRLLRRRLLIIYCRAPVAATERRR